MLVLSRKEGERLVIGGQVILTVVALDGGRVKIGIEAPPQIGIQREELLERPRAGKPNHQPCRAGESPFFAECW